MKTTKQKVLATLAGFQKAVLDLSVFIAGQADECEIMLTQGNEVQVKVVADGQGGYDLEEWDTHTGGTTVHSNDEFVYLTGYITAAWARYSHSYVCDELRDIE